MTVKEALLDGMLFIVGVPGGVCRQHAEGYKNASKELLMYSPGSFGHSLGILLDKLSLLLEALANALPSYYD